MASSSFPSGWASHGTTPLVGFMAGNGCQPCASRGDSGTQDSSHTALSALVHVPNGAGYCWTSDECTAETAGCICHSCTALGLRFTTCSTSKQGAEEQQSLLPGGCSIPCLHSSSCSC